MEGRSRRLEFETGVRLRDLSRCAPVQRRKRLVVVEVRRGEFLDQLQVRGEVKAGKSIVLTAPSAKVVEGALRK